MKTILFFGDSNTWGHDPVTEKRHSVTGRFPGLIRGMLPECTIIEEGLRGRTTATDDDTGPLLNGRKALPMILSTHAPVDYLVIMLGTNDTKQRFSLSPREIALGLESLIQIARTPYLWQGEKAPKILVVCPASVSMDIEGSDMFGMFDQTSVERSKLLHTEYQKIASQYNCDYFNAMDSICTSTVDGVHLEAAAHKQLAQALYQKLVKMMEAS